MEIDYSLYPDLDECDFPDELHTVQEQADYIHRFCSSWDFLWLPPHPRDAGGNAQLARGLRALSDPAIARLLCLMRAARLSTRSS